MELTKTRKQVEKQPFRPPLISKGDLVECKVEGGHEMGTIRAVDAFDVTVTLLNGQTVGLFRWMVKHVNQRRAA